MQEVEREVPVVHEVVERGHGDDTEVLLSPHRNWGLRGCPVLGAFTTKVKDGDVGQTLKGLRGEMFGGDARRPWLDLRLRPYEQVAHSPTANKLTRYVVHPVLSRYCRRSNPNPPGAQWLPRRQALALPELSPTVRGLLVQAPPAPAPDSLEGRLLAARQFGTTAVAELLIGLSEDFRRQASRYLFSRQDQEDAAIEAVMSAVRRIHTFVPGADARRWLSRIVRNQAFSILRARGEADNIDGLADVLVGRGMGPEEEAQLAEYAGVIRAAIRRVLARNRPQDRLVWRLLFNEGLKYRDITQLPGINYRSATQAIHRMRNQLRDELGGPSR